MTFDFFLYVFVVCFQGLSLFISINYCNIVIIILQCVLLYYWNCCKLCLHLYLYYIILLLEKRDREDSDHFAVLFVGNTVMKIIRPVVTELLQ